MGYAERPRLMMAAALLLKIGCCGRSGMSNAVPGAMVA